MGAYRRRQVSGLTPRHSPYYKNPVLAVDFSKHNSALMSVNPMADKDDLLLNSREVAYLLDMSPDNVNELARRNVIPAFKKGRQWRFRKRDVTLYKRQLKGLNAAA
jgi:excisionase family DNA binding protein